MSTVPRGIFLPPQPQIVREIVAKPRHIYAYASHPRILDPQNHPQQQQRRREFLSKQNSINNHYNQSLQQRNIVSKNIRVFDEFVEARFNHDTGGSNDKVDEAICGIAGVKITRTR